MTIESWKTHREYKREDYYRKRDNERRRLAQEKMCQEVTELRNRLTRVFDDKK